MWGDDRVSQGTIRGWWAPTRGVGLRRVLEAERGKDPKSEKWEGSGWPGLSVGPSVGMRRRAVI